MHFRALLFNLQYFIISCRMHGSVIFVVLNLERVLVSAPYFFNIVVIFRQCHQLALRLYWFFRNCDYVSIWHPHPCPKNMCTSARAHTKFIVFYGSNVVGRLKTFTSRRFLWDVGFGKVLHLSLSGVSKMKRKKKRKKKKHMMWWQIRIMFVIGVTVDTSYDFYNTELVFLTFCQHHSL